MSYRTEDKVRAVAAMQKVERIWAKFMTDWVNELKDNAALANSPRFFIVGPTTYFTSRANKRRGVRGRAYSLKWRVT